MSNQGKLYFFLCHMLYTAMQLYYEVHDDIVDKGEQANSRWNTCYHMIMGWTLEEIVFPLTTEQVEQREGKTAGDLAEAKSEVLYNDLYEALLASANHLQELCEVSQGRGETVLYYQYCAFLYAVLKEFIYIVTHQLEATIYIQGYQQNINAFIEYSNLLKTAYIDISQKCLLDIEIKAEELKVKWVKVIYLAVDELNLS